MLTPTEALAALRDGAFVNPAIATLLLTDEVRVNGDVPTAGALIEVRHNLRGGDLARLKVKN